MASETKDSLRLTASKGRFFGLFSISLIFFVIALWAHFPLTIFYYAIRILEVLFGLSGMVLFGAGILTNKYDAVLSAAGFQIGKFFGKRLYLWIEIKAVYVIRETTGKCVCIEVNSQNPKSPKQTALIRLPSTYGMDADELAKTLLKWQCDYRTIQSN